MPEAVCPVCNRPQGQGLLCHACTSTLEYELGDVPAVVADLDVALSRQDRMGATGKAGLARERLVYHQRKSIAAGALANTLTTWARDVTVEQWKPIEAVVTIRRNPHSHTLGPFCEACPHRSCAQMRTVERHPAPPPPIQAARLLLDHIDDIRRHPAVDELHDEVVDSIRQARADVDRPANRAIIAVGPCPEVDEDGAPCPGQVLAFIPTADDRPARMECKADAGHRWTSIQWLRTGKRILDRIAQQKREARLLRALYGDKW